MRSNVNTVHFEGRIYQKNELTLKVTGPDSKKPGTEYISGNLHIAVDEEGLNVIPVHFSYVTACWGNTTKPNKAFPLLKKIIEEGKTWVSDGKDNATKVKIDGAIDLNEFFNAEDNFVSSKVNEGSFIEIVNELCPEENRNKFTTDMIIVRIGHVDANAEKHIEEAYTTVNGVIFNYRGSILPVEFTVTNEQGMKYFEDLEVTGAEPLYTKVWGRVNCNTSTVTITEDAAFGEAAVRTYERKSKTWEITGTSRVPYEFDDEKTITKEEFTKALQDREVYKADMKKKSDDFKAKRASSTENNFGAVTAKPSAEGAASAGANIDALFNKF